MSYRNCKSKRPLRLLQVNVCRGATPHEIALEFANKQKYDIIFIQEPFISRDRQRRITKRISSYECFTPIDSWETRPRVLTYVRKGIGLQTYQLRPLPPQSPAAQDIVFLEVRAPSGIKMLVVNLYNAPSGSIAEEEAVRALLDLPRSIFRCRTFLAGGFNLKHTRWQASVTTSQSAAESLLEWTDLNSISLISEADVPTHNRGSVLDLSFASNSLILAGAESATIPELDVTSDHLLIGTIIPWDSRFQEPVTRLKLDTLDENLFYSLLQVEMARMPSLPVHPQPETLDTYAESLCSALQNAFRGSARRALWRGTGQPWWNDECRDAARAHRIARSNSQDPTACAAAKKELRIAVRRAKRQFFRNFLDQASSAKDVFVTADSPDVACSSRYSTRASLMNSKVYVGLIIPGSSTPQTRPAEIRGAREGPAIEVSTIDGPTIDGTFPGRSGSRESVKYRAGNTAIGGNVLYSISNNPHSTDVRQNCRDGIFLNYNDAVARDGEGYVEAGSGAMCSISRTQIPVSRFPPHRKKN